MSDPTLPTEMQRVLTIGDGHPSNVGWVTAATRDQLLAEGSRAVDAWQSASRVTGGAAELRYLDAIDDELDWRDRTQRFDPSKRDAEGRER